MPQPQKVAELVGPLDDRSSEHQALVRWCAIERAPKPVKGDDRCPFPDAGEPEDEVHSWHVEILRSEGHDQVIARRPKSMVQIGREMARTTLHAATRTETG